MIDAELGMCATAKLSLSTGDAADPGDAVPDSGNAGSWSSVGFSWV